MEPPDESPNANGDSRSAGSPAPFPARRALTLTSPSDGGTLLYSGRNMSPQKRKRSTRKRRLTPKGEAGKALESAEACLSELEAISNSHLEDTFIRRLNEFLVSARRVSEFLPKENGRAVGLKPWLQQQDDNLLRSDPRYAHFRDLRTISTHDCIVRPDIARQSVEISSQLRFSGHLEVKLRDAKTGQVTGRGTYDGPVATESVHEEVQARTKYFFADWPSEDIATFCREILKTLRGLVSGAYRLFQ